MTVVFTFMQVMIACVISTCTATYSRVYLPTTQGCSLLASGVCVCVGGFTIIYKSGSSLVYVEGMFNSVMYIQNIVQIVLLSFLQQEKANCFSVGSGDNAYPYNAYST